MIIIGGGPAGSAAAITLARYTSLKVAVVERHFFNDFRAGEAVSPSLFPLLDYLGIAADELAAVHLPAYGHSGAWGSAELQERDFLFTGQGEGLLLDRKLFDTLLLAQARLSGVKVYQPAEILELERKQDWSLRVKCGEGELDLAAPYVIDCSGRRALLVQRSGCRVHRADGLVGLYAYYETSEGTPMSRHTLVESTEHGWYYHAPLPGGKAAVAFITDADLVKKLNLNDPVRWLEQGMDTKYISKILAILPTECAFRHYAIHSRVAALPADEPWTAAGDAAASFDPIAGLGIGHAIQSGIHSARVAEAALKGDRTLALDYRQSVLKHFETYLHNRQRFYAAEKRWPDAPFWQRRSRFS
jgi:2-polyprenyl-6-methoxyphenol hydroxylase-like FAD-dependent oxidoreductase